MGEQEKQQQQQTNKQTKKKSQSKNEMQQQTQSTYELTVFELVIAAPIVCKYDTYKAIVSISAPTKEETLFTETSHSFPFARTRNKFCCG